MGLLVVGLLVSLVLTSRALERGSLLGESFLILLFADLAALLVLAAVILTNLARLISARRKEALGARLTTRLLGLFVVFALVPAAILFFFSFQFIQRSVESWFQVEVESALDEALEMAQLHLDRRRQTVLTKGRKIAGELAGQDLEVSSLVLSRLRRERDLAALALFKPNGTLVGSSSSEPSADFPRAPSRKELLQASGGQAFSLLVPGQQEQPWRVLAYVPVDRPVAEDRILRVEETISASVARRSESIQQAAETYRRLQLERGPVKTSFLLTLTLILVLTVFVAIWLSFRLADRISSPIRELARGTRAVARGEYGHQIPVPSSDELGVLVRSFNTMTRRLASAQEEIRASHSEVQARRAYLQTILDSLTAGVVTLDTRGGIDTVNPAAREILALAETAFVGKDLDGVVAEHPQLQPLSDFLSRLRARPHSVTAEQVELPGIQRGTVTLLLRGAPLRPGEGAEISGFVVVFDDITELSRAQRASAWGEVARRLAHEIKNPLTPIQLSAERLRRKYLDRLGPEGDALDRATTTIIQQVESLRDMVNTFAEYARHPGTELVQEGLNDLVEETVALYQEQGRARIETDLAEGLPPALLDHSRMAQVLGNLIRNAQTAVEQASEPGRIRITTGCSDPECQGLYLEVADDGPGFPAELLDRIFDPYVSTNQQGSGLGLAIVRKIVEEHGGRIQAENSPEGGAWVRIWLPAAPHAPADQPEQAAHD